MANILIVDDSKFLTERLKDILTKGGHTVVGEAKNGHEAIVKVRQLKPDLVTMDLVMKEVEGIAPFDAIEAITKEHPLTKVFVVSAMVQESFVDRATKAGASAYIFKPLERETVLKNVKIVLGEPLNE